MDWHPFAEKFPLLKGAEWEAFKADIQKTNGPAQRVAYRVVNGQKQGLDGRNRFRACQELGIDCPMEQVHVADDEVKDFVIRRNVLRRHMSDELRRELVADLYKDGKSTRQIGDTVGVSHTTVRRDLEAGGTNVPPEAPNGRVTGKDGKSYSASQPPKPDPPKAPPKPKILCKRCERVGGAVQGCTNCKMAREAAKASTNGDGKGDAHEGEPKEPKVALMDQLGNPVPKGLRDTFVGCRESLEGGVKLLQEVKRTVKDLSKWNAWMRPTDMETKLAELIEDLKNGLPYSVCQDCSGKGCKVCRQEGWLTRWRHEELAAK